MKNRHLIILLTLLYIGMGCKDNNSTEEPTEIIDETPTDQVDNPSETPTVKTNKMVYAWVDMLRVREFPNSKSNVLIKVPEGDSLTFMGEETLDKMKVTLRGKVFNEPWLKVKTRNETVGWVYGGGVTNVAPPSDRSPLAFDACYIQKDKHWIWDENCVERTAKKELRQDRQFVTKRNTSLIFNLLGGDLKTLKNNRSSDSNEYVDYTYLYYLKKMGYFVLRKNLHEGHEYLLVNDKTGAEISILGFPKASPNGHSLVAVSADLATDFNYNGIQIWRIGDNGLVLDWENEMTDMEPFLPKWYNNKTIQISLQKPAQERQEDEPAIAYIRLDENGEWGMNEE